MVRHVEPTVNAAGAGGQRSCRFLVAAFGDAGHAFPAIGLARALAARGHEVVVETWEHWREAVHRIRPVDDTARLDLNADDTARLELETVPVALSVPREPR